MIDCTITKNFLNEISRMCDANEVCKKCELGVYKGNVWCREYCEANPEEAIKIVQKWSDEHPQRTMLDDFKEKYPNAPTEENGIPKICPYDLGYDKFAECPKNVKGSSIGCIGCWNRPYKEEQK